jgi:Ca2+-transporting ATPase
VVRDGRQVRIAGRDVVRGDVALLAEGDRVPADATLVDCVNLSVDESVLTGESVPVRKAPAAPGRAAAEMGRPGGDDSLGLLRHLAVKGHGIALVNGADAGTELGRIGTALRTIEPERTLLQHEIGRLVRVIAALGMAAAAVFALTRGHWLEGLLAGIATAMTMLPEEFPVVLTVFLALGAWRMSQRHAEPVFDPARRLQLASILAETWNRYGPPSPIRRLMRRLYGFDYDQEVARGVANAEQMPIVVFTPISA